MSATFSQMREGLSEVFVAEKDDNWERTALEVNKTVNKEG